MNLRDLIRTIPDYPKPGIMFRDITTLLGHPDGFKHTIQMLADRYAEYNFDYVAGIEARGFILGAPIAANLGKGFIPVAIKSSTNNILDPLGNASTWISIWSEPYSSS